MQAAESFVETRLTRISVVSSVLNVVDSFFYMFLQSFLIVMFLICCREQMLPVPGVQMLLTHT